MPKFSYSWEKKYLGFLLILPVLLIFVIIAIYPFLFSIYISLFDWWLIRPQKPFVGFENFVRFVTDQKTLRSLVNTLALAGTVVSAQFGIGLGIALALNYKLRFRGLFVSMLIVPMVMAPVIIGIIWKVMLNDVYGVLNYLLSFVWTPPTGGYQWLTNPRTALATVMIVDVWQWTPFMALILLAGLMSLSKEHSEAAKIDGASELQIFLHVTLPLLKPVILVGLLIRTIDVLKIFDKVYIMTQGGPGILTQTITFRGFMIAFRFLRVSYGAAIGLILNIIIIVVAQVFIKLLGREAFQ